MARFMAVVVPLLLVACFLAQDSSSNLFTSDPQAVISASHSLHALTNGVALGNVTLLAIVSSVPDRQTETMSP
jgi:hypothetical protein